MGYFDRRSRITDRRSTRSLFYIGIGERRTRFTDRRRKDQV